VFGCVRPAHCLRFEALTQPIATLDIVTPGIWGGYGHAVGFSCSGLRVEKRKAGSSTRRRVRSGFGRNDKEWGSRVQSGFGRSDNDKEWGGRVQSGFGRSDNDTSWAKAQVPPGGLNGSAEGEPFQNVASRPAEAEPFQICFEPAELDRFGLQF
jgi:hypothetical protein